MSTTIRVLMLEDRAADAELILHELRQAGFDPDWQRVETEPDYLAALETNPDLILADWSLPQFSGLRALQLMNERGLDISFIIVSGSIGEEAAVEAMRQGADDYVFKDRPARLGQAVQRALQNKQSLQERKQAEEALRQAEEKYRTIFENAIDAITQTTLDGKFLSANPAAARQLGYNSPEELIADVGIIDRQFYVIPGRRQEFIRLMEEHEKITKFESEIYRKDGSTIWISENSRLVRDKNGDSLYYEGTTEEITERKRAEDALRNSEIKLRSLFAAMSDVIIVYDADGRYLEIALTNPTNLYRPLDDMLGKTVTELFPPAQAGFFLNHIRQTLKTGQLTDAEYNLKFGNEVRWFSASVSPLSSNSVIWVARDITERKSAEEKIRQQLEHLSALGEVDRAILSSFDLRLSLGILLSQVTAQLGVDAADVLLFHPGSQLLKFSEGRGFRTTAFELGHALRLGEGYAGRVVMERADVHISDLAARDDNPRLARAVKGEAFTNYYGVPLIAKGKIKGVLEIFQRGPLEPDKDWLDFLHALADQAAIAIDNLALFDDLQRTNSELMLAYETTLEGWSHALDLRDKETEGHTQRVTEMTIRLARAFGLSDAELVNVRRGGLLHDIGKMGVPDTILLKPGQLTDEEWQQMRMHPALAYELLSPIAYLREALEIPYCHHEKWDGSGYPRELKGEQIPLAARIFAVVDVWDAVTSERPYRPAWTKEKAREHIRASSGTHFDPQVVDVFLKMIG